VPHVSGEGYNGSYNQVLSSKAGEKPKYHHKCKQVCFAFLEINSLLSLLTKAIKTTCLDSMHKAPRTTSQTHGY